MIRLWLASALLLASCSALHALPDPLLTSVEQIEPFVATGNSESIKFTATARVEYYGDGQARKGKLFIVAQLPHSLRMEALTFTDDMLSLLVVDSTGFKWYERGARYCYSGPLCAAPIVARFPMVSRPEVLLPLLLGRVPLLRPSDSERLEFDRETGLYRLTIVKGDIEELVDVEPESLKPVRVQVRENGQLVLNVSLDGQVLAGAPPVPQTIRLEAPGEKLDLSIEYREFYPEESLPSSSFTFTCPAGTVLRELGCGGE